jgi:2-hydroxy-3-oxopropionate reductase
MGLNAIGLIGLGRMGNSIGKFLLKAGYSVTGYDIDKQRIEQLIPLGIKGAGSPKECAKGNQVIILSLTKWEIVNEVVEGRDGILEAKEKGQIIVDTSTVPPWKSKAMAEKLAEKGIQWMDATISGSAAQAREGNMVFMVGGKKENYDKVKEILDKIGKKTIYAGENGNGAMLKIVVNTILLLNQAAAIEGFALGLKSGLNPEAVFEAVTSGSAGSDLINARGKDMLNGNYEEKGPLTTKSLDLALESAQRLGMMMPIAALYRQFILQAIYNGWEGKDATVVLKVYEELAKIKRGI